MKPSDRYSSDAKSGRIQEDPLQLAALAKLDDLHRRLALETSKANGLWARLFASREQMPERGLYLWGGVGRGKTYLMDLFYESLPTERKLRMHFHRFMHRVHRELQTLSGTAAPLSAVADTMAEDAKVLCFDEFFVSDIGDAMILGELLTRLFERGVSLVATSNVHPDGLYANGLQRRRFLPAIELLKAHSEIYQLDGGVDYRLRTLEQAEIYHFPLDEDAERSLGQSFEQLAPDQTITAEVLDIEGRPIRTRFCADDVVWFDFAALCDGPRSQNDYIEIARLFHAVLISNVPCFTAKIEDQARRFIALVDEFYDHDVKLICSAEVPVLELYQGTLLKFEFERTKSRLLEMQSMEYLGHSHRA